MNKFSVSLGALALTLAVATPALAADTAKAQATLAAKCKKLTPSAAKKNAKCVAIQKHDAMTSSEGSMMAGDQMMSAEKPK